MEPGVKRLSRARAALGVFSSVLSSTIYPIIALPLNLYTLRYTSHTINAIKLSRLRAGLTQKELARRCGMSQAAVARIEGGRVSPRLDTAARILRECGMRLEAVPRSGQGIDRTTIRRMLALTPRQRLAKEARNLETLRVRRRR
jgi:transcriptional regulator with XRE-family HTH domain